MKFSLTLGPRRLLDRQTAWGCLTANLAGLPGLGSLAAGQRVGYVQIILSLAGLAVTSVFGIRFIIWYASHLSELNQLDDQGMPRYGELWTHLRWALLGIAIFSTGWLWALASSISIVVQAKSNGPKPAPPLIKP
jgi:hypothetical protein